MGVPPGAYPYSHSHSYSRLAPLPVPSGDIGDKPAVVTARKLREPLQIQPCHRCHGCHRKNPAPGVETCFPAGVPRCHGDFARWRRDLPRSMMLSRLFAAIRATFFKSRSTLPFVAFYSARPRCDYQPSTPIHQPTGVRTHPASTGTNRTC